MRWIALHSNLVSHVTRFVHILHWRLTIDDDTLITLHCTHVFFLQYLFLVPSLSHHPIEYKCICLPVMPCVMSAGSTGIRPVAWPGGTYEYEHNVFFYIVRSLHWHPLLMVAGGWLLVAGRWFCLHYVNVPVHNKPRMHHTVHYTVVTNQRIESNQSWYVYGSIRPCFYTYTYTYCVSSRIWSVPNSLTTR